MIAFLNWADSEKLYVEVHDFSKKLDGDPVSICLINSSIYLSSLLGDISIIPWFSEIGIKVYI